MGVYTSQEFPFKGTFFGIGVRHDFAGTEKTRQTPNLDRRYSYLFTGLP